MVMPKYRNCIAQLSLCCAGQLKSSSELTLKTLRTFPALLRVPIDPAVVTAQLHALLAAKVWKSAVE